MVNQHEPTDDLRPNFTTARGTVVEWIDPQRQRSAAAFFARRYYEHHVAHLEAARARDPDHDERVRRMREASNPDWERHYHPVTPDVPEIWEPDALAHKVRVLFPDSSMTLTYRPREGVIVPLGKKVVNPRNWTFHALAAPAPFESLHPGPHHDRDDLDAYCYGPHTREALALLQPRCFFHGREPRWEERVELDVLGRAACLVPMRRTIPLSDPRILGDAWNPTVLDETEETEVIVDVEQNVVLEWRGLFDGQPYERHFFTEISFDEPMDESEFEPEG